MADIKNVIPFKEHDFTGIYIALINPDKIPHLIFIENGAYFTLTYNACVIGKPFLPYLQKLKRLQKKIIFLKLKGEFTSTRNEFNKFKSADTTNITCFVPIKNILKPDSNAEMIHELIPELYENQIVDEASHLNMEDDLNFQNDFPLSVYTKKMIFSYIEHLKTKDARRK